VWRFFATPIRSRSGKDEFSVFTGDERYVTHRQFTKFVAVQSRKAIGYRELVTFQVSI
jgi:hypothetical protein